MKIIQLDKNPSTYTCNSYLILGDWNGLKDINTLIDPGTDGNVIEQIKNISTGCGKLPVQQIILTHNHFDHASGVASLKQRYGTRVLAFSNGPKVEELLRDGQCFTAGNYAGHNGPVYGGILGMLREHLRIPCTIRQWKENSHHETMPQLDCAYH